MWNVFVISDDGECEKVNSEPYAVGQVDLLLDKLMRSEKQVMLVKASDPSEE